MNPFWFSRGGPHIDAILIAFWTHPPVVGAFAVTRENLIIGIPFISIEWFGRSIPSTKRINQIYSPRFITFKSTVSGERGWSTIHQMRAQKRENNLSRYTHLPPLPLPPATTTMPVCAPLSNWCFCQAHIIANANIRKCTHIHKDTANGGRWKRQNKKELPSNEYFTCTRRMQHRGKWNSSMNWQTSTHSIYFWFPGTVTTTRTGTETRSPPTKASIISHVAVRWSWMCCDGLSRWIKCPCGLWAVCVCVKGVGFCLKRNAIIL